MRALIVDDDEAIVEVVRDAVSWEKLGIEEVCVAYDGECAREILKEKEADIVISDIEMPRESGLELLQWYRDMGYKGKFLLLTSHESFAYAAKALELHASDYLLKPFNVEMMEMVLKKNISSLEKERQIEESAEYGQWIKENMKEVKRAFLDSIISGRFQADAKTIEKNIQIRKLDLDIHRKYCLVVSKVTNFEQDSEEHGPDLIRFILQNFHSELLCERPENDRVIVYERKDCFYVVTVCDMVQEQFLLGRCRRLIKKCGSMLESTITCCISRPCTIDEFREAYQRVAGIQERNVIYCGEAFQESQVCVEKGSAASVLDLEKLKEFMQQQDKKSLMEYLKREVDNKVKLRVMDAEMLHVICQEFQQAVYTYLANRGIQVSRLFGDALSVQLADKARQSVVGLMRWANYLLEKVFAFEEEIQKSQSLIEKIHGYICEHYKEEIGRNEIGAEFHLVPEYLARLYKKKTGRNLKDYINEYRIEQAKILLKTSDMLVSDVSAEVGIDNISYFSTLFRKCTGMSPNEYRKQ